MVLQMNIKFDNSAIKNLNEICRCTLVEGLDLKMDDLDAFD